MTLSVFLRNPAQCRGPERSASGLRAGALPSAHPAGAAALHPAQRQEAMLLAAWLPVLRGWCAVVRSGAKGICKLFTDDGADRLPQVFVRRCLAVWKNMYACAGATHSAILRCCRMVEPLGLAFRQCSLYPHTHFSLHLSRGLMTGQPGAFLPCYVLWYRFPSQVRQVLSDMEIRLLPCDW